MTELLKTAIITEWQKASQSQRFIYISIKRVVSWTWMCCEEWLWTCQTVQSRSNNGVH